MLAESPNTKIAPYTARTNTSKHLEIGGCDTVELAKRFGTPLYVVDEETIIQSVAALKAGLADYAPSRLLYAGKAFLCLAMCRLVHKLGLGLDVVSGGELHTALSAGFPPELIYMHGNNKSFAELNAGLVSGPVTVVIDNLSELRTVQQIANQLSCRARVLLRVTPGVIPNTHHYIATGHNDSKFGLPLGSIREAADFIARHRNEFDFAGLHAHIGSQSQEVEPYLEIVEILADCAQKLNTDLGLPVRELDVGGGLAIAYQPQDKPVDCETWSRLVARQVKKSFQSRESPLPCLVLEPGRAIIGTAGVTLYTAGHEKLLPGGLRYLAVDGGMADNPRPVMYQAQYSACVANKMTSTAPPEPLTLAGKYCESGDIVIKDIYLAAETGDIIAVFNTGAYNYSMASNYNRTARPACVLVSNGKAEIIIERETYDDLLRYDRIPARLAVPPNDN